MKSAVQNFNFFSRITHSYSRNSILVNLYKANFFSDCIKNKIHFAVSPSVSLLNGLVDDDDIDDKECSLKVFEDCLVREPACYALFCSFEGNFDQIDPSEIYRRTSFLYVMKLWLKPRHSFLGGFEKKLWFVVK